MSQHHTTVGQYKIIIGWDPPLGTFFALVRDQEKNEDEATVLWIGTNRGEVRTVDALEAELAPYCALKPELCQILEADRLQDFGYPLVGYIYDNRGYHGGKVWIWTRGELDRFMAGPVCQARLEKRKVEITNGGDFMICHFENGQLVWPS